MKNYNNHHSSACAFGELLVSYLYAEANDDEKTIFESHLASCQNCQTELSAFGETSRFVKNWREAEFAPLLSPIIELPAVNLVGNKPQTTFAEKPIGWAEKFRQFFNFTSPYTVGASAFAALVLIAFSSLIFGKIMLSPLPDPEVVQINKSQTTQNKTTPTPSPTTEQSTNTNLKTPTESTKVRVSKETSNDAPIVKVADNNSPKTSTQNTPTRNLPTAQPIKTVVIPQNPSSRPVRPNQKNKSSDADLKEVEKGFRELLDKNEKDNSLSILDVVGEVSEK